MKFQYIIQLAFVLGARAKENSLIAKNRGLIGGIESYQPKTVVTDYVSAAGGQRNFFLAFEPCRKSKKNTHMMGLSRL